MSMFNFNSFISFFHLIHRLLAIRSINAKVFSVIQQRASSGKQKGTKRLQELIWTKLWIAY
uniref:Putative secreted peptide n=1 Tax=Anopheles darlingi TaxID=43151 RepID=B6DE34_ANODA